MGRKSFERMIETLDRSLFKRIPTQSKTTDQWAWLAIQRDVRERFNPYCYLEIGSWLGGSLQTHLRDPRCERVFSIDSRTLSQPDPRLASGCEVPYPDNSTDLMMERLRVRLGRYLGKLSCFDSDASRVPLDQIQPKPHLMLIDGEHTDRAVLSDFEFCASIGHPQAIIMLHDYNLVHAAMRKIAKRRRPGTDVPEFYGQSYSNLVYAWTRDRAILPLFTAPLRPWRKSQPRIH